MSLLISSDKNINYDTICRDQLISMIIDNAVKLGWGVEQKNKKVYILRKKMNIMSVKEQNTDKLVDMLFDVQNF